MSFSTQDTIVAVATPPGRGGIGVVRLSGPAALAVAQALLTHRDPLQPRHATLSKVQLEPGNSAAVAAAPVDQVVATFFPSPHSYTGEDVVELSAHGSPVVLGAIVSAAIAAGARLAEPGEFTLRAYLSGRIDLVQAEAVNDLIDAVTPLQARAAFDQLDGTLTRAYRRDRRHAVRSHRAAGGISRFSGRGLSLRRARRTSKSHRQTPGAHRGAARRCAARPPDSRRIDNRDRRRAERRQVEPLQRARRRVARDRHRGCQARRAIW